jgi:orotate phosphoribosyltransferase
MEGIMMSLHVIEKISYDILDDLQVKVTILANPYQIPIEAVFSMAARKNVKRGFLFVSKLLGKHIPVHPLIPLIGGAALAERYLNVIYNQTQIEDGFSFAKALTDINTLEKYWAVASNRQVALDEETIFIGFAETATALGYAMFAQFSNANYIHTTRENISGIKDVLNFKEEHSHAPDHHCYAVNASLFDNKHTVVLVDDEITTGRSALNFIRAIQDRYPHDKYVVAAILDWRSPEDRQRFLSLERELGISIQVVSLITGSIAIKGKPVSNFTWHSRECKNSAETIVEKIMLADKFKTVYKFVSVNSCNEKNANPYLAVTGRFGITSRESRCFEQIFRDIGSLLRQKRQGKRTLCLGTGEFMYVPFRIAEHMGEGVVVQSTTRSPVYPVNRFDYAVRYASHFLCPEDFSLVNYVYNVPDDYYDEVFIFFERQVPDDKLHEIISALGKCVPRIYLVILSGKAKEDI